MEKEIKQIKLGIEKAISIFLEQLDESGIDVDCVEMQIKYNDGLYNLKLNI